MLTFPGTPVIVLGMGRSGTSYLSSFLGANGVSLGDELIESSIGLPGFGFFRQGEHWRLAEPKTTAEGRISTSEDQDGQLYVQWSEHAPGVTDSKP